MAHKYKLQNKRGVDPDLKR